MKRRQKFLEGIVFAWPQTGSGKMLNRRDPLKTWLCWPLERRRLLTLEALSYRASDDYHPF